MYLPGSEVYIKLIRKTGAFRSSTMKHLFISFLFSLFASICAAQTVTATNSLIADIANTVRSVMPVDAKLTRETHTRFWQQLSQLPDADRSAFLASASKLLSNDLARQKAMWLSMRETLNQKRVVVHPDYAEANARMRSEFEAQGKSSERLEAEVRDFGIQLDSIAAGKPISQGGKQARIDIPLINRVLAGLEGSYDRVSRLLDKNWQH